MPASIYTTKEITPDDQMLSQDLAGTKQFIDRIAEFIKSEYGDFSTEWKFYNQRSGWLLKMFTKKRNVLFIIPCNQHFRVVFTMGDRAVDVILQSSLPETIKQSFIDAKKYAEGRTIQFEVWSETDFSMVVELIRVKYHNK